MAQRVTFLVYTDGACKDNNSNNPAVVRRAGSALVAFCQNAQANDALLAVFNEYCTGGAATLARWRTCLMNGGEPFSESVAVCRAITLPISAQKPSNNRAELYAFNSALAHFLALSATLGDSRIDLEIHVDSTYVMTVFRNADRWKRNGWRQASGGTACNIDYVDEMLLYADAFRNDGHTISVHHVAAHSKPGDVPKDFVAWRDWFGNDLADRISNVAAGAEADVNYTAAKESAAKKKRRRIEK